MTPSRRANIRRRTATDHHHPLLQPASTHGPRRDAGWGERQQRLFIFFKQVALQLIEFYFRYDPFSELDWEDRRGSWNQAAQRYIEQKEPLILGPKNRKDADIAAFPLYRKLIALGEREDPDWELYDEILEGSEKLAVQRLLPPVHTVV